MAQIITKIILTEDDIRKLVVEKYGLDLKSAIVNVEHYKGDARDPSYTKIIIEGSKAL